MTSAAGATDNPRATPPRRGKPAMYRRVLALFFGPVFDKELRVAGRRKAHFIFRGLYALTLLGITTLVFIGEWGEVTYSGSPAEQIAATQDVAPTLAFAIISVQFAGVLLISPSLTSGIIGEERRRKTLPALLTTPISASQIVFSKLAASLVQLATLVLLSLPLLLGIRIYGGLPLEPLITAAVLTLATAFLGLACGLHGSTARNRGRVATLSIYGLFIAVLVLPPVALWIYAWLSNRYGWGPSEQTMVLLVFASSPLSALGGAIATYLAPAVAPLDRGLVRVAWLASAGITIFFGTLLAMHSVSRLRALLRSEADGLTQRPRKKGRQQGRGRRAEPAQEASASGAPDTAFRLSSREIKGPPVLWRELATPLLSSRFRLASLFSAGVTILAAIYALTSYANRDHSTGAWGDPFDAEGQNTLVAAGGCVILLFQAAVSTTSGITSEREAQTWDTLLTTRLRPLDIMWGKLAGAVRRQWPVPALVATHFIIVTVGGPVTQQRAYVDLYALPLVLLAIIPPALMLTATGLAFSLVCRKTVTASSINLGLAVGLWIGIPVFVLLLGGAFGVSRAIDQIASYFATLLPPASAGIAAMGTFIEGWSHGEFGVGALDVGLFGWIVISVVNAGLYLGAAAAALVISFGRFNTITKRSS